MNSNDTLTITSIETQIRITRGPSLERAIVNATKLSRQRHRSKDERRQIHCQSTSTSERGKPTE